MPKKLAPILLFALIKIQRTATEAGVHLVMVKCAPEAWKSIELTRLDRLFPHADTIEEAVKLLEGISS